MPHQPAQPRWKHKRFGDGFDLYLRTRWLGGYGPVIHGECSYSTPFGLNGRVPTQEDAKRAVESLARAALVSG